MTPRICLSCRRLNPGAAAYCYFDGTPLATDTRVPRSFGSEQLPKPFAFPSGRLCRSFEELARACRQEWADARSLLKQGQFRAFLLALGRTDLMQAAEQAAAHPDPDVGLDEFLVCLPGCKAAPPRLQLDQAEIDLGSMAQRQDRQITLTIENAGERLLSGVVLTSNCLWLGAGTPQLNEKRFHVGPGDRMSLSLFVRSKQLRAGSHVQAGEVVVQSNGGARSVQVRILVPVTPFPEGVLKGAVTPRQLVEKARAFPHETARLLEDGSVARWYQTNGWVYPITGPAATGLAIVQQYFEVLGLTSPPRAELRTAAVSLQGAPGGMAQGRIVLTTTQKRPLYAHGKANQPWLSVGAAECRKHEAVLPLSVPRIPDRPGEVLRAEVAVQANGDQYFKVPIALQIGSALVGAAGHSGRTGFDLPPLPAAGGPGGRTGFDLPPLPGSQAPPPLGAGETIDAIPLAEARADSPGARSRRILSCVCLVVAFFLLSGSAALAAWKLLQTSPATPSRSPAARPTSTHLAPRNVGEMAVACANSN